MFDSIVFVFIKDMNNKSGNVCYLPGMIMNYKLPTFYKMFSCSRPCAERFAYLNLCNLNHNVQARYL